MLLNSRTPGVDTLTTMEQDGSGTTARLCLNSSENMTVVRSPQTTKHPHPGPDGQWLLFTDYGISLCSPLRPYRHCPLKHLIPKWALLPGSTQSREKPPFLEPAPRSPHTSRSSVTNPFQPRHTETAPGSLGCACALFATNTKPT